METTIGDYIGTTLAPSCLPVALSEVLWFQGSGFRVYCLGFMVLLLFF